MLWEKRVLPFATLKCIHVRCSVLDSLAFRQIFLYYWHIEQICARFNVVFQHEFLLEVAKHQWKTHHELELRHWINPAVGEAFRRRIDPLMLRS